MLTCILNASVVTPHETLPPGAVLIKDDRIAGVLPPDALDTCVKHGQNLRIVDAQGAYVLPGIIDIHSDYIEGIIQPRPTSMMDFSLGLRVAESQLAGQGITMMYHSLSLMQEHNDFEQRSMRRSDNVQRLVALIRQAHEGRHLIRHRFHARYEIDNLGIFEDLKGMIRDGLVHELSFMDHTPGQGQYRDIATYSAMYKQWKRIASDEALWQFLRESEGKPKATHEMLMALADLARDAGVPLASHDDDTLEKLNLVREAYRCNITEFPITMDVARAARRAGMHVVVGAPNILLGGSHAGNLSAREAIEAGFADILCSDYYPPAMLSAVFRLAQEGVLPLHEAVGMVTLNPACAMHIDREYGSIAPGKKADLLVVEIGAEGPLVRQVFVDGQEVVSIRYRDGEVREEALHAAG